MDVIFNVWNAPYRGSSLWFAVVREGSVYTASEDDWAAVINPHHEAAIRALVPYLTSESFYESSWVRYRLSKAEWDALAATCEQSAE